MERYTQCRCLYHRHAIDPCQSYGRRGHHAQENTVLIVYDCAVHKINQPYKAKPAIRDGIPGKGKVVVEDDKPDERPSSSRPVVEDDILSKVE